MRGRSSTLFTDAVPVLRMVPGMWWTLKIEYLKEQRIININLEQFRILVTKDRFFVSKITNIV